MDLSTKRKSIFTLVILLAVMICLAVVTGSASFNQAYAGSTGSYATFEMIEGAQTRVDDTRAIRFVTKMSATEYDALATEGKVEVITMITPARYLDRVGKNNADDFVKDCSVRKEEIIFSEDFNNLPTAKADGYYYFNACIFGVLDTNITQKFAARSYLLLDGELLTHTEYDKANNKSIYEVALATKNLPEYVDTPAYDYLDEISSGVYAEEFGITVNGIDGKTLELTATYGQPLYAFTEQLEQTFNKEGVYYWTGEIEGENEFTESTPITESGMAVDAKFISLTFVEDGDGYAVAGASTGFYDMTSTVKIPETFNGKPVKAIYADAFTSGVKEIHIPEGVIINANAFNGDYPTIVMGENTFTYKENATKVDYMSYRVDGNGELVFYDELIAIAYAYDDNYIAIPTPADIADANSVWMSTYSGYVADGVDTSTLTTPELWWKAVYDNRDAILVEDRAACYYVKGLNDKSLTTVNIPETFDDGVNGELPVKYIGLDAFYGNTTITKVFATETLTELRGRTFSGASNLQLAVFPGVKYLADITVNSSTLWTRENFNYCDNLTKLVVGDKFTSSGINFKPTSSSDDGWYKIAMYFKGEKSSFDYTNWKTHGYLLSDTKRYAYGEVCDGKHWYYDANGEPQLSLTTHQYVEGKCTVCGAIEMTTVAYAYDDSFIPMPTPAEIAEGSAWRTTYEKYVPDTVDKSTLTTPDLWWTAVYNNKSNIAAEDFVKCYYVTGLVDTTLTVVHILGTFNDGVHGELDVRYAKYGAFDGNKTITKVFATEKLTELRGRVFAGCSSLKVVVIPGVKYISGLYQDTASPLMHSQNFNGVASSSQIVKLVVGDDFTDAGTNFKPSSSSYENKINLYVYGDSRTLNASYWNNWAYRGYSDSRWFKYDETGLLEGKYWHFDENGEPVHNVHVDSGADGVCDTCADVILAA